MTNFRNFNNIMILDAGSRSPSKQKKRMSSLQRGILTERSHVQPVSRNTVANTSISLHTSDNFKSIESKHNGKKAFLLKSTTPLLTSHTPQGTQLPLQSLKYNKPKNEKSLASIYQPDIKSPQRNPLLISTDKALIQLAKHSQTQQKKAPKSKLKKKKSQKQLKKENAGYTSTQDRPRIQRESKQIQVAQGEQDVMATDYLTEELTPKRSYG